MRVISAPLKATFFLVAVCVAGVAMAEPELRLSMRTVDVVEKVVIGTVEVDDVGTVQLIAMRQGGEVVVRAVGPAGEVIGRAQATVGLRETPIYIQGRNGLKKINIRWGVRESSSENSEFPDDRGEGKG